MRKVFKYTLEFDDYIELELPVGAKILHFGIQHDHPRIWALVDPVAKKEIRKFRFTGTGQWVTELDSELNFIGTALMLKGSLVWHLFEIVEALTG